MDFWRTALETAEKAAGVAKIVSQRGLVYAEEAAEEAAKKIRNLNLQEKVTGTTPSEPPTAEELALYGISPSFQEFVSTLNVSLVSEYPPERLIPLNSDASASPTHHVLNAWQVRHATLVCLAVKDLEELRFALCPRYMTDEVFWHVYFSLTKEALPAKAFDWHDADTLPRVAKPVVESKPLSSFSSHLRSLGERIQHTSLPAVELASIQRTLQAGIESAKEDLGLGHSYKADQGSSPLATPAETSTPSAEPAKSTALLEVDPDLEAYLQVAIAEAHDGGEGEENASDAEDEIDFDSYLNELSGEPESGSKGEESAKAGKGGETK